MTKFSLFLLPILFLYSCSYANYDCDTIDLNSDAATLERYKLAKSKAHQKVNEIWKILHNDLSRATPDTIDGNQLFLYLINLPQEEFDSLYNLYCTEEALEQCETVVVMNLQSLMNQSSVADVNNLSNFSEEYINMGGHNPGYLTEALNTTFGESPGIIQDCAIENAAIIDEYLPENPIIGVNYASGNEECLKHVINELIESQKLDAVFWVGSEVSDMLNPVAGLVVSSVGAFYSMISTLCLTHEYHKCLAERAY